MGPTAAVLDRRRVLQLMAAGACGAALPWLAGGCGHQENVCWPALPFAPGVERGPQVALASPTSLRVAWRSQANGAGFLELGTNLESGARRRAAASRGRDHVVELTGLRPETRYEYRFGLDDAPLGGVQAFTTWPRRRDAPVRFAVIGDSGSGCAAQLQVATVLAGLEPDLVLHTGDVVYPSAEPEAVTARYFAPYAALLSRIPFYPTLGNHDVKPENGRHLLDALQLPTNDADGSSRFYSFERGDCLFVALDTARPLEADSPQLPWLERQLRESHATWKFVYTHRPFYTSGPSRDHRKLPAMRELLGPILDAHGVDIVFHGNDHLYERTYPIRGGRIVEAESNPNYVDPQGTIYVISGGGGKDLDPIDPRPFTAYGESSFHAVLVEVSQRHLRLSAVRRDGSRMDRVTLVKRA